MNKFANAIELAEANDSFNLNVDYSSIIPGIFVKVCELCEPQPERYWLEVTEVNGRQIQGTIANNLVFADRNYGDTIECFFDNIFELYCREIGKGSKIDNIRAVHAECN